MQNVVITRTITEFGINDMEDYEDILTKSCNDIVARVNKKLQSGFLFNPTAARKRIKAINKSIDVIVRYVELNSWFMDVQDVIDNQRRIAKLRGEKKALAQLLADHDKKLKEAMV